MHMVCDLIVLLRHYNLYNNHLWCLPNFRWNSNIKEWRLFADVANDVGLTFDLVAPVFRGHFALVSSLGVVCKVS